MEDKVVLANLKEVQRLILQSEIHKLVEKGAVQPIKQSHAHITSLVSVVPKSRGGLRPIIDLRYLNSYLEAPHFKMNTLYMLPSIINLGWFMVKIDLKDVYLTIPIAHNFQCLLEFQAAQQEMMQFQCLLFADFALPTNSPSIRHSHYHLSKRSDASSRIREPTTLELVNSSMAVCYSWFHYKYSKECNNTNPVSGIFGICNKHTKHDHRSTITDNSLSSEIRSDNCAAIA